MELSRIKFHNVLSYEELDLDFSQLSLALFIGGNGAGKSNIFDGLSWIIFDRLARKKYGKQKIIRDLPAQQKQAIGEIEFKLNESNYRLIRKEGAERGIYLERNGGKINLRTPTQSQEEFEKIIGMDYSTYTNVACFSQGSPYKFLASESGERIKVLSSVLGTGDYDKAAKIADKRIKKLEGDLHESRGKINSYENIVANTDIKVVQTEKKLTKAALEKTLDDLAVVTQWLNNVNSKRELERDLELQLQKFSAETNVAENRRNEFKESKSEFEKLIKTEPKIRKRLSELKIKIKEIEVIQKSIAENQESYYGKQESIAKSSTLMGSLSHQKRELELLLKTGGSCPTCTADIEDHASDLKKTISSIGKDYANKKSGYEQLQDRLKVINSEKERLEKELLGLQKFQIEHTELLQKIVGIKEAKHQLETIDERLAAYTKTANESLSVIKKTYNKLKEDLTVYKDYDLKELEKQKAERDRLELQEKELDKELSTLEFQQKQFNLATKTLSELRESAEAEEKEYQDALYWKQNFPRVKLLVISETVPYIQALTNHNLSKITDSLEISLKVDPLRVNDRLDVIITDKRGVKPKQRIFEGWSGGQKDGMSIASFLALNKLASQVSGCKINFLLLDERFSSIDSNKRAEIFELLRESRGDRKLLAISHVEDIEGEFNEIVRVHNENGISRLEVSN